MSNTGTLNFTQASQQARNWVDEIAEDLGWPERRAYWLLRAVLHALRDWLTPEEMADLSAQLPVLIRGIYFERWKGPDHAAEERTKENFVRRIEADFATDRVNESDAAITAVFGLLDRHISEGEIAQVRHSMKKALRRLWPAH
jgi:uncharacterized protein (DUF2267 family)